MENIASLRIPLKKIFKRSELIEPLILLLKKNRYAGQHRTAGNTIRAYTTRTRARAHSRAIQWDYHSETITLKRIHPFTA